MKLKVQLTDDFVVFNSGIKYADFEEARSYKNTATSCVSLDDKQLLFTIGFSEFKGGVDNKTIRYNSIDNDGYMKLTIHNEDLPADEFEQFIVSYIAKNMQYIEDIEAVIEEVANEAKRSKEIARSFIKRI